MVSITLSVPQELKLEMDKFEMINWSAVAREAIKNKIMIHPLIVQCSRLKISGEAREEIANLLDSDLDWPNLIQSMVAEATLPLVYRCLKEFEHKVPAAELGKLRNAYLRNTGRNMSMFKKLEPLLNAISDAGLMVTLTRGARLAETVYRDWGLRHFVDVDFMVHPQEASHILEILKQQGIWTDSHTQRFSGLKNKQLHWIMETGRTHGENRVQRGSRLIRDESGDPVTFGRRPLSCLQDGDDIVETTRDHRVQLADQAERT